MPSVLLVGDLHGNADALHQAFLQAKEHGAEAIIQLGDFGYGWSVSDGQCNFANLASELASLCEIRFHFVDGNHENFDLLYSLPVDENGHRTVAPGVVHLHRGSKLTIGSTVFLALGGAYSVDKPHRKEGISWWAQESITDDDVERALAAGEADVLLTHDIPRGVQDEVATTEYLDRFFGAGTAATAFVGQDKVRKVFDACGAQRLFHGHLHSSHEFALDGDRLVVGLNKERDKGATVLLDC